VTPSERTAAWVLADADRPVLQDPAEFVASLAHADPDETPTLRAIPDHGRTPCFSEGLAAEVPEVRYDLAWASAGSAYFANRWSLAEQPQTPTADVYAGLTAREREALCDARCDLVDWASRLGAR